MGYIPTKNLPISSRNNKVTTFLKKSKMSIGHFFCPALYIVSIETNLRGNFRMTDTSRSDTLRAKEKFITVSFAHISNSTVIWYRLFESLS